MKQPLSGIGRLYATIAFIEAFTWLGLLTGMFLKYVTRTTEDVVTVFGYAHGFAFLVYVLITVIAAFRLRWGVVAAVVALAASVPPLCTIPMEIWLRRRGRLSRRVPSAGEPEKTATVG